MKKHTDEEIIAFFKELCNENSWGDKNVKVVREDKKIIVHVEQEYEFVEVDFKRLKAIGEFFETDKVNGSNGDYYTGCETCDYGSSYEVDFVIEE